MTDNKILGNWGEEIAKQYLIKNDYTFITQNYKASYCEIDLIFKYKNKCIFIEVKTRLAGLETKHENPLTYWQTKNLQRALIDYCFENRIRLENTRLDLIIILVDKEKRQSSLKHFQDILC